MANPPWPTRAAAVLNRQLISFSEFKMITTKFVKKWYHKGWKDGLLFFFGKLTSFAYVKDYFTSLIYETRGVLRSSCQTSKMER